MLCKLETLQNRQCIKYLWIFITNDSLMCSMLYVIILSWLMNVTKHCLKWSNYLSAIQKKLRYIQYVSYCNTAEPDFRRPETSCHHQPCRNIQSGERNNEHNHSKQIMSSELNPGLFLSTGCRGRAGQNLTLLLLA